MLLCIQENFLLNVARKKQHEKNPLITTVVQFFIIDMNQASYERLLVIWLNRCSQNLKLSIDINFQLPSYQFRLISSCNKIQIQKLSTNYPELPDKT